MRITGMMTDSAVLRELGTRIARLRIDKGLTQQELAREAAIGLASLVRLENGDNSRMTTIIKVLRELGRLEALDVMLPAAEVRPMELLRNSGKAKRRVTKAMASASQNTWTWGDEQ